MTNENIDAFRVRYRILEPIFTFPFNPLYHRKGIGSVDMMLFWTKVIIEGGLTFPLHPLLQRMLMHLKLFPLQCGVNFFRIVMGVVALNDRLGVNLGVDEILFCYDLRLVAGGRYYL